MDDGFGTPMKMDILTLRKADWAGTEREVVFKMRLLHGMVEKLEPTPINDKIAADLIMPALQLLAEFCNCVVEGEEEPGETPNGAGS